MRRGMSLEERYFGPTALFNEREKRRLLADYAGDGDPMFLTEAIWDATEGLDPVTRMQQVDLNLWLAGDILLKADKMSMAHSLELRVPFLDREVWALAAALPLPPRPTRARRKLPCARPRHARCPPPAPRAKSSAFLCRCGTGCGRSPTPAGCGPCSAARQRRSSLTRARCIVC